MKRNVCFKSAHILCWVKIFILVSFIDTYAQPPVNDDPCAAIFIPVDTICTPLTFSNVGATPSSVPNPIGCPGITPSNDVWFKVQVPASGRLNIVGQSVAGGIFNTAIAVYKDTCNSLVEIGCDDNSGPGNFPWFYGNCLTPGQILHIRLWAVNGDTGNLALCAVDSGACLLGVNIGSLVGDDKPCLNETVRYSITQPPASGVFAYKWSVTNGQIVQYGGLTDGIVDVLWDSLNFTGNVQVIALMGQGCCTASDTVNLPVSLLCTSSDVPSVQSTQDTICSGCADTLTVINSVLGSCSQWVWYEGFTCNATPIGYGDTIIVYPTHITLYLVHAVDSTQNCGNTICTATFITVLPNGMNDVELLSGISVYPNPAIDNVTIQCSNMNAATKINLSVYDLIGKKVYSSILTGAKNTLLLELSPGVYLMEFNLNEYRAMRKVVIR